MSAQSMTVKIGLVLVIIFIVSASFITGFIFPDESVIDSQIIQDPVNIQTSRNVISHSFPFQKGIVSLSFPVNASLIEETKKADRVPSVYNNDPGSEEIADAYRAMVMEPAQEQIFSDLLEELRKVRSLQGLSDDEYLELMAVYVQSLRYESLEQNPAKFPAETIIDGAGDCDDKSLLLAGLLAREDYSVSLMLFRPEAHMAIGIGSDDYLYKKTGYAFLETTNYSFIGMPTDTLGDNLSLSSDPTIIIIYSGKKRYSSGDETRYIHENYLKSDQKMKELSSDLINLNDDLMAKRIRISDLDSQIALLRASGNIREYNSQVLTHSTLVSIYNKRLTTYKQIYAEYNKFASIHKYIFEHTYDRKGVYDYIKKNIP